MTTHGSVIPAACALFVEHRRETVYLTAGALPEYRAYQAPALLVHEGMLRLCVNSTQPRRFNMYGITGVFTTRMTKAVGYWNSNRDSTGMPRSWSGHSSCDQHDPIQAR